MKSLERIVIKYLLSEVSELLDPLQFAYRARRGVEDACITLLNNIYKHLENPESYVRILFVDFSSAFNTIQPHLLMEKLMKMRVNSSLIKWLECFLVNRQQTVSVNGHQSSPMFVSTGAPQGCVLSPLLFILYTNDCNCFGNDCISVKFADDVALAGMLQSSELLYRESIRKFTELCKENYLVLNVQKTKEMIIDFRKKKMPLAPVTIDNHDIECVTEYKYLGTIIDHKLTWNSNTDYLYKKGHQRLYFLRRLRYLHVDSTILYMFYKTCIQSVITFNFLSWFNNLSIKNKSKILKIVNIANKITGVQTYLELFYVDQVKNKVDNIVSDSSHILFNEYQYLPSGRRLRVPKSKSNRYRQSFVPSSVMLYNDRKTFKNDEEI